MAFLDNSGDIILDAVLTDTGRMRLAKGDGSFRVQYFALADDEIDYSLYNRNDSRGSAYYDLDIMLTPVLEAFTDNRASLNSKLMSINRTDLLYLPVLLLNEQLAGNRTKTVQSTGTLDGAAGSFCIVVDNVTIDGGTVPQNDEGIIDGATPSRSNTFIRIDQGELDSGTTGQIEPTLMDTAYLIEIDNRLGSIVNARTNLDITTVSEASPSFVDDDDIATYFLSQGDALSSVQPMSTVQDNEDTAINGRRGTKLMFSIRSRVDLSDNNTLFDQIGYQNALGHPSATFRVINSVVRVTGVVTGRRVDIPVKFIKKV